MEQPPLYRLRPLISRLLLPQLFKMIFLAIILFFAVFLNIKIMGIVLDIMIIVYVGIFIFTIVMINLFLIYTNKKTIEYDFYPNRIVLPKGELILFHELQSVRTQKNKLDKIFDTETIILKDKKLDGIQNGQKIKEYIEALIKHQKDNFK